MIVPRFLWPMLLLTLALGWSRPIPAGPPPQADQAPELPESIWVEGEAATRTTFNRHNWYSGQGVRMALLSPGLGSPARTGPDAPGDWLAHYSSTGGSAEADYRVNVRVGGSYVLWLRASTYRVRMWVRVDAGPQLPVDLETDVRETVNLTLPTLDLRFLAWARVGPLTLSQGQHTLTFGLGPHPAWVPSQTHGGIDALCLVNFDWQPAGAMRPPMGNGTGTGAGTDLDPVREHAPEEWFPLVVGDDAFDARSVIDMSALNEAPAGGHGALTRVGERFEFADGTPVVFWGMDAGMAGSPELQRQQARLYRKHGVNLVRLHPVESTVGLLVRPTGGGERQLDPARLDRLDRWFATLKAEGIYQAWSLFYPHVITPDDGYPADLYRELPDQGGGKSSSGMVNFMGQLQAAEWAWARSLLEHRNPYTGLRYVDDPGLAIVEAHNEDSVFWHAPLNDLVTGQNYPRHTAEMKAMWQRWLRSRYADDRALLAAWGPAGQGSRTGDSLANPGMDIYGAWELAADGPAMNKREARRMGDFIRFLAESQRAYFAERGRLLRALGFKGVAVSTAWMSGGPAADAPNVWTDDALDAIDRHNYEGGGVGNWRILEGAVNNGTHLGRPGQGLLSSGFQQVEDKPFVMSEWSQTPPNQWKAEAAPLMAFYGMGLNGWDGLMHFSGARPRMGSGWPDGDTFVSETPHYLAQFPALALATRRHDFQEAQVVAGRRVALDDLFRGVDALTQDLPRGGFAAGPGGSPPATRNLTTPPEVLAIGRVTQKADAAVAASTRVNWDSYWDRGAGIVRSVTGELEWRAGERVVLAKSPRTQAVVGFAGGRRYELPGASVAITTPFVSLILSALDDRPLGRSTHLLVTAMAQDRQLGSRYNADVTQLVEFGGPPLMLEPVQAEITFKGAPIVSVRALDVYGVPVAGEVSRQGNVVPISGRYATYYYEVRTEPLGDEPTPTDGPPSPTPIVGPPSSTPTRPAPTSVPATPTATVGPTWRVFLPIGRRASE